MKILSLRSSKAFTLIELLIVISIIGILAIALLPRITTGPAKARDAQRKADLQQLATAIALYAEDNGAVYPYGGCVSSLDATSGGSDISLTPYMTSVPTDPVSTATVGSCTMAGSYGYYRMSGGFMLVAKLESVSATGTGIYDIDASYPSSATDSSSTWISANSAYLCGGTAADCSSDTATYYLLAR